MILYKSECYLNFVFATSICLKQIGFAGTGKSLFLEILESLIPKIKQGIIGSDSQQTFGLSSLVKGQIQQKLLCYEVSNDLQIREDNFKSMSAGDKVSLPVKHQAEAIELQWDESMWFAGNSFPPWVDKGDALIRRVVLFLFENPIKHMDGLLKDRILERKFGALVFKIAYAYMDAKRKFFSHQLHLKSELFKKYPELPKHIKPEELKKFFDPQNPSKITDVTAYTLNGQYTLPPSLRMSSKKLKNELDPFYDLIDKHLESAYGKIRLYRDCRKPHPKNKQLCADGNGNWVERAFIGFDDLQTKFRSFCREAVIDQKDLALTDAIVCPTLRRFNLHRKHCYKFVDSEEVKKLWVFGIGRMNDDNYDDHKAVLTQKRQQKKKKKNVNNNSNINGTQGEISDNSDDEGDDSDDDKDEDDDEDDEQALMSFDQDRLSIIKTIQKFQQHGQSALAWTTIIDSVNKLSKTCTLTTANYKALQLLLKTSRQNYAGSHGKGANNSVDNNGDNNGDKSKHKANNQHGVDSIPINAPPQEDNGQAKQRLKQRSKQSLKLRSKQRSKHQLSSSSDDESINFDTFDHDPSTYNRGTYNRDKKPAKKRSKHQILLSQTKDSKSINLEDTSSSEEEESGENSLQNFIVNDNMVDGHDDESTDDETLTLPTQEQATQNETQSSHLSQYTQSTQAN